MIVWITWINITIFVNITILWNVHRDSCVPLCRALVSVLNGSLWITTDKRVCTFSRDNVDYSYAELTRGDALSCRLARIHLYLRGRTKLCWQHGRHDSGLFYSPLCLSLSLSPPLSLSLSLFLFSSPLARTAFILFSPLLRWWEPPTCSMFRQVIFERKKERDLCIVQLLRQRVRGFSSTNKYNCARNTWDILRCFLRKFRFGSYDIKCQVS